MPDNNLPNPTPPTPPNSNPGDSKSGPQSVFPPSDMVKPAPEANKSSTPASQAGSTTPSTANKPAMPSTASVPQNNPAVGNPPSANPPHTPPPGGTPQPSPDAPSPAAVLSGDLGKKVNQPPPSNPQPAPSGQANAGKPGTPVSPPAPAGQRSPFVPSKPTMGTAAPNLPGASPSPLGGSPVNSAAPPAKPGMPTAPVGAPAMGSPTASAATPGMQPPPPAANLAAKPMAGGTPPPPTPPGLPPRPPASAPPPAGGKPGTPATPPAPAGKGGGKPPAGSPPATTQAPPAKKSIFRFLPVFILLLLAIAGIAFGAYYYFNVYQAQTSPGDTDQTPIAKKTITYWGLWEPEAVLSQVFDEFESQNPEYQVQYVKQSHVEYRARLQAAIANGEGPDVFRFHASWTPMMRNELSPLPERTMTTAEFSQTFYPVAQEMLTVNSQIMGIPLMYDGLGLYYNKDVFAIANRTPPTNWEEVKEVAQELTLTSGDQITRGGIAMGTTNNVEHFPEILSLLILQNGGDPSNPTSQQSIEAMQFYTDFSQNLGVWDETFPLATEAFGKGNVAMMIAPSWRAHEIQAANPNIQFDIVPLPQLTDGNRVTWGSFWAEGVNSKSSNREGAWKLLEYMASAPVQQQMYAEAAKVRAFGEIYSRRDLASNLAGQPYVAAYIEDAPYARGWYSNAYTHDQGINDQIITIFTNLIQGGQSGIAARAATAQQEISTVLTQYGITSTTTVPATQ